MTNASPQKGTDLAGTDAPEEKGNPVEKRSFKHALRVSYAHCTLSNHVYYSRYLEILEAARGEFFRSIGFSCLSLQQSDVVFQVTECFVKYHKPARYDDEIEVHINVGELRKVRVRFEYRLMRGNELLVTGWSQMVCATTEEKPERIPESVAEAFRPFMIKEPIAGEIRSGKL